MKLNNYLLLLIISLILYFNYVKSEKDCRILNFGNQKSPQNNDNNECRLHSRYEKISQNQLYCNNVCYINNDYYNFNNKLFLELPTPNQLLLSNVDKKTRSFKPVIFNDIQNNPYQIIKTHSIGSKVLVLIRAKGKQYLGIIDTISNVLKPQLIELGRDGLVDAKLDNQVIVIEAKDNQLIKKRIDINRLDKKYEGYSIAHFDQQIRRIRIINDVIDVDIDDEERDIPLINCSIDEEARLEQQCQRIISPKIIKNFEENKNKIEENNKENEGKSREKDEEKNAGVVKRPLGTLPPPKYLLNQFNPDYDNNNEDEEVPKIPLQKLPPIPPPKHILKKLMSEKKEEKKNDDVNDDNNDKPTSQESTKNESDDDESLLNLQRLPEIQNPKNNDEMTGEDEKIEEKKVEKTEDNKEAKPSTSAPLPVKKISSSKNENVHRLPVEDDFSNVNNTNIKALIDEEHEHKETAEISSNKIIIYLLIFLLILLIFICCCTKILSNRTKQQNNSTTTTTGMQGSSYQPVSQSGPESIVIDDNSDKMKARLHLKK